ncbi:MAG: lactate racemase domain-containing protein, partial [Anaerolineae bacterium]
MTTYHVPYSTTTLEFDLLPGMRGRLVKSKRMPPLEDMPATVDAVQSEPVNSPPLRDLARPGDSVCIVFTDATRACPDDLLIPPILRELEQAGVRDEDITLLCGIGM